MIRIGTSGFSFPDWKGIIYPADLPPGEMLAYYSGELGFNTVEVNSSYYRILTPAATTRMSERTPDDFEFTVKAFRGMTHDPFDPRLTTRPSNDEVAGYYREFSASIEPLRRDGKLGAILLQFPVFFHPSQSSRDYILQARDRLPAAPLAIEFRNSEWARDETFDFLRRNDLAYCTVDEPKLPRLMPFLNRVTSSLGYARFHGRNPKWFSAPVAERYNYHYRDSELEEFTPVVRSMNIAAGKTYLFFNNCHQGAAAINAMRFRQILGLEAPAPRELFN